MNRRDFLRTTMGAAAASLVVPEVWLQGEAPGHWKAGLTIRVDHPQYFRVNDIVHIPRTGESMLVTNITEGRLSVLRGLGGQAQAILDDDPIWILGSATPVAEDTKPAPLSFPAAGFNSDWMEDELLPSVDLVNGSYGAV